MAITFAAHQPCFAPWPGLFFKASKVDKLVLLDRVQFPTGFSWMNRNRIKGPAGPIWLTVPIYRKGRGLQTIDRVEVLDELKWRRKHLLTFYHAYKSAPFFKGIYPFLEKTYLANFNRLLDLNMAIINFIADTLGIRNKLVLQSSLGVENRGTCLITDLAKRLGADTFIAPRPAKAHLDTKVFIRQEINIKWLDYQPAIYPQLWGDFLKDLSSLDMLMCYGRYSKNILFE